MGLWVGSKCVYIADKINFIKLGGNGKEYAG